MQNLTSPRSDWIDKFNYKKTHSTQVIWKMAGMCESYSRDKHVATAPRLQEQAPYKCNVTQKSPIMDSYIQADKTQ